MFLAHARLDAVCVYRGVLRCVSCWCVCVPECVGTEYNYYIRVPVRCRHNIANTAESKAV